MSTLIQNGLVHSNNKKKRQLGAFFIYYQVRIKMLHSILVNFLYRLRNFVKLDLL